MRDDRTMSHDNDVIGKVRRALGRSEPLKQPPTPPEIPDPIARLVHTDIGLAELFAKRAGELKMDVSSASPEQIAPQIVEFARSRGIKRIALSVSPLLEQLGIFAALRDAEFEVTRWDAMTLDELYDFDCAITDVNYAVAETGSLVIKTSAAQGRGLSLVPMYHVAIVEPRNLLPDLVDLFDRLQRDTDAQHVVMISGPSKTADIEMNVVTGVHGPNVVKTFLLT
jgi:L-lactate dehydrogenase complex protein LldG